MYITFTSDDSRLMALVQDCQHQLKVFNFVTSEQDFCHNYVTLILNVYGSF
jgi:hypothetical protein